MLSRLVATIALIGLVSIMTLVSGCGSANSTAVLPSHVNYTLTGSDITNFALADSTGKPATSDMVAEQMRAGNVVSFQIDGTDTQDSDSRFGYQWDRDGKRYQVYTDRHDIVAPCANMKNAPHLNFKISEIKSGRELTNIHIWLFYRGGWKIGIWDKPTNFCKATEASYEPVRKAIEEDVKKYAPAFTAAVISVAVAWVVIYVAIPAIIAVFGAVSAAIGALAA